MPIFSPRSVVRDLRQVRDHAVAELDTAQDIVGTERLRGMSDEAVALHQCFIVALQMGELSSYLTRKKDRQDDRVIGALRDVATITRGRLVNFVQPLLSAS
jgi:hypothetical protein